MEYINYGNIRLGIADTGGQMLTALKQALQNAGFRRLTTTQKISDLESSLNTDSLDLIICDAELSGGNICDLVRRVRQGELGNNPFVKFLIMLSSAEVSAVEKIIDCGIDDLLVRPITAGDLQKRISHMMRDRKPFVITFDYIGPDRRAKPRPGSQEATKIEVPNILQHKIKPDFKQHLLSKQISQAREIIKEKQIERQAHQISYRAEKAIEAVTNSQSIAQAQSMKVHLGQLVLVAENILPSLAGSAYAQEDMIINTIIKIAKKISNAINPDPDDMEQLEKMATLIRKSFKSSLQVAA